MINLTSLSVFEEPGARRVGLARRDALDERPHRGLDVRALVTGRGGLRACLEEASRVGVAPPSGGRRLSPQSVADRRQASRVDAAATTR